MNYIFLIFSLILIIFSFVFIFTKTLEKYSFDSIYLVSLKKDKERRRNVLKNININYIYAYDGSIIDRNYLINNGLLNKEDMKKGEIGVYFSHLHMIIKAIKKKSSDLNDSHFFENYLFKKELITNLIQTNDQILKNRFVSLCSKLYINNIRHKKKTKTRLGTKRTTQIKN